MSDDDHHLESKDDVGASKIFPQQAGTIRKNGYIVIKGCPCKVVEILFRRRITAMLTQLIDISEDGFVSILTDSGNTKDNLKLPTDENLFTQIKEGFAEGKDLVVSVMSAVGEE
ncbi:hypothetical protein FEM48_Zijuj09G0156400 [Ziziphus jujuba var. spinosa]|uniref:Translation initiation factor 5A C-terminal domain-containing protein n=1 Tax=Ziziphus jujuba var. spinosa TaxID=714518 RepID=A0A978UTU6_ZIZJJ|nr:hypothetical protein FEM48_Zijuj09G0156400 [Ziziphus jujuba var. spinosa]